MIKWTDEELAQMKEWDKLVMAGGPRAKKRTRAANYAQMHRYYLAHREERIAKAKEYQRKIKEAKA